MKPLIVVAGQKFNMLTVLEELPITHNGRVLRCQCDCGNIKNVLFHHLKRSLIKSCGCYKINLATKHGMWESREYASWENMVQRCTNPKSKKFYLYGGRGITICERWKNSFKDFYEDMGSRPPDTSIDRIDPDKGYYKENCKWSTRREQLVNVRYFSQLVRYGSDIKTAEEWIKDLKINRNIFKLRVLRGLSFKEALFCNFDIVSLNVNNREFVVDRFSEFLNITKFEKEKVLELLDKDHEEPYFGYLVRYVSGFNGWPDKYKTLQ